MIKKALIYIMKNELQHDNIIIISGLDLCWPSLDLVDDKDSFGIGTDSALQVGAADGELSGQFLLGNILQKGPG